MKAIQQRPTIGFSKKVPPKTACRISKIVGLLNQAIQEVHTTSKKSPSKSLSKRMSQQSSEAQTINQVLGNLKKGYLMIKHSQNTSSPHDKFVYLSTDDRYLCWKSVDKEDQKKMEIASIERVIKEGAEFYIKSNGIQNINRCLVIISSERRLQLETASDIEAEYFRYELNRVVKYWKGMRLNYKYNKIC